MRLSMSSLARKSRLSASGSRFRKQLLRWYDHNKRDLPWRKTRDAYRVWISETMLQQTRVAAVVDYYHRFLECFPTIAALAAADIDDVLAVWSGLGYYRRARALHESARKIVNEHGGAVPRTSADLRTLPGVGRYTAAAIASIAFNEPLAVVDGNVERVLQRIRGSILSKEEVWQEAELLLCRRRPGDFNQALMELGATICLPRAPKCLDCPVHALCRTRGEMPAVAPEVRRKREVHYALNLRENAIFLVRRPTDASLMPDMWELPEFASGDGHPRPVLTLRHSITVTDYTVRVLADVTPASHTGCWIDQNKVTALPLTGLARKILRAAKII
jgi:A/G-specific adenine glycosylase